MSNERPRTQRPTAVCRMTTFYQNPDVQCYRRNLRRTFQSCACSIGPRCSFGIRTQVRFLRPVVDNRLPSKEVGLRHPSWALASRLACQPTIHPTRQPIPRHGVCSSRYESWRRPWRPLCELTTDSRHRQSTADK
jgi:hypothetical protein